MSKFFAEGNISDDSDDSDEKDDHINHKAMENKFNIVTNFIISGR